MYICTDVNVYSTYYSINIFIIVCHIYVRDCFAHQTFAEMRWTEKKKKKTNCHLPKLNKENLFYPSKPINMTWFHFTRHHAAPTLYIDILLISYFHLPLEEEDNWASFQIPAPSVEPLGIFLFELISIHYRMVNGGGFSFCDYMPRKPLQREGERHRHSKSRGLGYTFANTMHTQVLLLAYLHLPDWWGLWHDTIKWHVILQWGWQTKFSA